MKELERKKAIEDANHKKRLMENERRENLRL